jgi:energy-coupling factor transporter ATP-binding protein EcfA2
LFKEGNEEISSLQGMDVILIIGKTGVGKSSLIQMIHGVKLHRSPGVMAYEPVNSEMLLDDFKIGNIERSQTKSVRSYRCSFDKQLVFCDLPGYKDTDSYHIDIATSVWIYQIAKVCKSLRFVFMIHGATLEEDKGDLFRDLMDLLTKLMRNDPMEIGKGMLVLFTHMSDHFPEERDEEVVLNYIKGKIQAISNATDPKKTILMRLFITFIAKKTGHVRVLNPVVTNIPELLTFIQKGVCTLEHAQRLVQCSFSREVNLALSCAITKLETAIRDALISCLTEKQQSLPELVRLFFIFVSMLQTTTLQNSACSLIAEMVDEYITCRASVLGVVDSTVPSKGEILGKEEVQLILPQYNKLKLLNQILQEIKTIFCLDSYEDHSSHKTLLDTILPDDILMINLEFYRKCLFIKIDLVGEMAFAHDYSLAFEQFQNLSAISCLDGIIGKHNVL